MSSTVVLSFHPPASLRAEILHTPAVPEQEQKQKEHHIFRPKLIRPTTTTTT